MTNKILPISWVEIQLYSMYLADKLSYKKWDRIVAVTRGGLVPTAIIAHRLDIRVIDTFCVQSYSSDNQRETLKVIYAPRDHTLGEATLAIDDIVDSGITVKWLMDYTDFQIGTLFLKDPGIPVFYSKLIDKDVWIKMPYENY